MYKGDLESVRDELREKSPIREAIDETIAAVDSGLSINNSGWVPEEEFESDLPEGR